MEAKEIYWDQGWQDNAGASWSPPRYTAGCPCDLCPNRRGCQHECEPFGQWVTRGTLGPKG
jgi:hypothetical protein